MPVAVNDRLVVSRAEMATGGAVGHGHLTLNLVSHALRTLLVEEFREDPQVWSLVGGEGGVVGTDPSQAVRDPARRLSVWLFRVSESEFLRNAPPIAEGSHERNAPLSLDLRYLITPLTSSEDNNQVLLGRAMQILHDNPVIHLVGTGSENFDQIHITLTNPDVVELTGIWSALHSPFRLGAAYLVRMVKIESKCTEPVYPVLDAAAFYATIDNSSGSQVVSPYERRDTRLAPGLRPDAIPTDRTVS